MAEDKPTHEKCNFPGCDKMLKLPPWSIIPGSIQCLDHTRGQNSTADLMIDVLQGQQLVAPGSRAVPARPKLSSLPDGETAARNIRKKLNNEE